MASAKPESSQFVGYAKEPLPFVGFSKKQTFRAGRQMDYRVQILRLASGGDPTVVATLEWKYRTLEEAQEAGLREVDVTAETTSANGYRVLDEADREVSVWTRR